MLSIFACFASDSRACRRYRTFKQLYFPGPWQCSVASPCFKHHYASTATPRTPYSIYPCRCSKIPRIRPYICGGTQCQNRGCRGCIGSNSGRLKMCHKRATPRARCTGRQGFPDYGLFVPDSTPSERTAKGNIYVQFWRLSLLCLGTRGGVFDVAEACIRYAEALVQSECPFSVVALPFGIHEPSVRELFGKERPLVLV